MTVDSIRKATEKKGCQVGLFVVAALMVIGMVAGSLFTRNQNPQQQDIENRTAVTVDGVKVTYATIFNAQQAESNRYAEMGMPMNPMMDAMILSQTLQQQIMSALTQSMAQQQKLKVNDAAIDSFADEMAEMQITNVRGQLVASGKLKVDATEQEFEKVFEEETKLTTEGATKQIKDSIHTSYGAAETRSTVESAVLVSMLQNSYVDKVQVTEQQLVESFRTFIYEPVSFDNMDVPMADREAAAEKARADLQAGKPIAEVRAAHGAKKDDADMPVFADQFETTPGLASLKDMKVGDVSEVESPNGFPVVYRLKDVRNDMPANFEAEKSALLAQRKRTEGARMFQEAIDERLEKAEIVWEDDGLEAIYETGKKMSGQAPTVELLTEVVDNLDAASSSTVANVVNITKIQYLEQLMPMLPAAEQDVYREKLITAYEMALEQYEQTDFRVKLAELYLANDDSEGAFDQLLSAIQFLPVDMSGEMQKASLKATIDQAVTQGKLDAEQKADLDAAMATFDENLAEEMKRMEEDSDMSELDNEEPTAPATTGGTASTTGE